MKLFINVGMYFIILIGIFGSMCMAGPIDTEEPIKETKYTEEEKLDLLKRIKEAPDDMVSIPIFKLVYTCVKNLLIY